MTAESSEITILHAFYRWKPRPGGQPYRQSGCFAKHDKKGNLDVETWSWICSVANPVCILHASLNNLQEFEKIPLFMKKAPSEIDPKENPDLACLQSIIFDDERPPEGIFHDSNVCFVSP